MQMWLVLNLAFRSWLFIDNQLQILKSFLDNGIEVFQFARLLFKVLCHFFKYLQNWISYKILRSLEVNWLEVLDIWEQFIQSKKKQLKIK